MAPRLIFKILLYFTIISQISCTNPNTNKKPVIHIEASTTIIAPGKNVTLDATVTDEDNDKIIVSWEDGKKGVFDITEGERVVWTAPAEDGDVLIIATANDGNGGKASDEIALTVFNNSPIINLLSTSEEIVLQGNKITLTCSALDPDGGALSYQFTEASNEGEFIHLSPSSATAEWVAPILENIDKEYTIKVFVTDSYEKVSEAEIDIFVYSNYGVLWIVDSEAKNIYKYSSTGKYLLTVNGNFDKPYSVATNVDEFFGCYVTDYNSGHVYKISEAGEVITSYTSFEHPNDIDIYQSLRQIWVLDVGDNSITVINGYTDEVIGKFVGLMKPRSLKINQETGDVWVTDTGNNRIIRIPATATPDSVQNSGAQIFEGNFNEPYHLSFIHSLENTIYVADYSDNELEEYSYISSLKTYIRTSTIDGFTKPTNVAVTGDYVWVIDYSSLSYFHKLNPNNIMPVYINNLTFRLPTKLIPIDDEFDNQVWVVDNGRNQMIKLKIVSGSVVYDDTENINGFIYIEDFGINQ